MTVGTAGVLQEATTLGVPGAQEALEKYRRCRQKRKKWSMEMNEIEDGNAKNGYSNQRYLLFFVRSEWLQ